MIQHMVWFQWTDGVTAEHIAVHQRELEALRALVPGIRHLSFGTNFTIRAMSPLRIGLIGAGGSCTMYQPAANATWKS